MSARHRAPRRPRPRPLVAVRDAGPVVGVAAAAAAALTVVYAPIPHLSVAALLDMWAAIGGAL